MDDGRLDRLEQALLTHARGRKPTGRMDLPEGFTGGVMRAVRVVSERQADGRNDFWFAFAQAAQRFAPAGALAATASYGYAQFSERLLNQALLALSQSGGGGAYLLAGLLPR